MNAVAIRFGAYQKPASIHNRAAARFGAALAARLREQARFELIGSVLDLGRKSGDLPLMVESGELALYYISTVRIKEFAEDIAGDLSTPRKIHSPIRSFLSGSARSGAPY